MTAVKLVTRCPACRTAFRVVADQLRLRQGLVRCGQCQAVFDARDHMVALPGQPAAATDGSSTPPDANAPANATTASAPTPHDGSGISGHAGAPLPANHGVATFVAGNVADDGPSRDNGGNDGSMPPGGQAFQPGYDPGYDIPALDAPTMLMTYPPEPTRTAASGQPGLARVPAETRDSAAPAAPAGTSSPPGPSGTSGTSGTSGNPGMPPATGTLNASSFLRRSAADDTGHAGRTPPVPTADTTSTGMAYVPSRGDVRDVRNEAQTGEPVRSPLRRLSAEDGRYADAKGSAPFTPEFLRGVPRQAAEAATPWHRRRGIALLIALLILTALAQTAMLFRSDLAGRFPYLRPLLETACAPFGCTVPPWRDIDALRIDTSRLQKQDEGSDEHLLAVTLRNQGRATVALPAIELIMTDLQDQLLLRRVLLPADYLAADQDVFAQRGLVAGMELPLQVRFRTQHTAANYRVLIFYP